MITLYTFGRAFGLPDPSAFVVKAEMLLKLADLPYSMNSNGFNKAPKGKLPYIEDNGKVIADSTVIRWYIESVYNFDFDKNLTQEQVAIAWSVEKMLEDNLYWAMVSERWLNDENFENGPKIFFKKVPALIRGLIISVTRKGIKKSLHAQGLGRYDKEDMLKIAKKDIDTVSTILGDSTYFLGEEPSGIDATVYAFMGSMLAPKLNPEIKAYAETKENIVKYVERITSLYYPDLAN